jgi:hypothetical protein
MRFFQDSWRYSDVSAFTYIGICCEIIFLPLLFKNTFWTEQSNCLNEDFVNNNFFLNCPETFYRWETKGQEMWFMLEAKLSVQRIYFFVHFCLFAIGKGWSRVFLYYVQHQNEIKKICKKAYLKSLNKSLLKQV